MLGGMSDKTFSILSLLPFHITHANLIKTDCRHCLYFSITLRIAPNNRNARHVTDALESMKLDALQAVSHNSTSMEVY